MFDDEKIAYVSKFNNRAIGQYSGPADQVAFTSPDRIWFPNKSVGQSISSQTRHYVDDRTRSFHRGWFRDFNFGSDIGSDINNNIKKLMNPIILSILMGLIAALAIYKRYVILRRP